LQNRFTKNSAFRILSITISQTVMPGKTICKIVLRPISKAQIIFGGQYIFYFRKTVRGRCENPTPPSQNFLFYRTYF